MALNFNVLAQTPSVAERFMAGRQAAQEEQQRNMLLQQRAEQAQLERENALVTRQKTMADLEAARQRKAALSKVAEVFRRQGKALDLDTLNEGMSWALESGNADAIKQVEGLRNLFLQQQEDERIFGPQPGAAAPAAPAGAVAAPPVVAPAAAPTMETAPVAAAPAIEPRAPFGFGARVYEPGEAGPGGAVSFAVAPPVAVRLGGVRPGVPAADMYADLAAAPPVNALAPEPAAPVNAMVAPEAAPGVQVAGPAALPAAAPKTFEYGGRTYTPQQIDMLLRSNRADRRDLGKAIVAANKPSREALSSLGKLLAEQAALPPGDPRRPAYDAAIEKESQRPEKGTPLAQYLRERDEIARANPADPRLPLYEDVIKKLRTQPEGTKVEVKLPAQEQEFEKALGAGQAKKILEDKNIAEDARSIIDTVQQGRQLLRSGMITGFGAEALTQIGAALNQAGISFASDSVANTQAFAANMAQNVGRIIKQFGAGTGLSNADREYAEKMAGGKITLDRAAIERILDINERAARNVITAHNKRVANIKTNVPLTVELPPAMPTAPAAPAGRPSLEQIFQPPKR